MQKAIAYYILINPPVHKKLRAELDSANLAFPAKYDQTKDLPYLNAVIKEGMRMHPVISGILERIVPSGGLTLLDGRIIAAGTKVGINPWVSTRNTDIYGEDADEFRPERWLQAEDETKVAYGARLKRMRDVDFTFGSGNRICIGRNMATVELHKVTATLFSRYDVRYLIGLRRCWSFMVWFLEVPANGYNSSNWTLRTSTGHRGGGGSLSLTTSASRSNAAQTSQLFSSARGALR